jgi:hypothetical protein
MPAIRHAHATKLLFHVQLNLYYFISCIKFKQTTDMLRSANFND